MKKEGLYHKVYERRCSALKRPYVVLLRQKKDRQKCVSHRDFYKHYIIALSSGETIRFQLEPDCSFIIE